MLEGVDEDLEPAVGLSEEVGIVVVLLRRHLLHLSGVVHLNMPWLTLLHGHVFELDPIALDVAILVR